MVRRNSTGETSSTRSSPDTSSTDVRERRRQRVEETVFERTDYSRATQSNSDSEFDESLSDQSFDTFAEEDSEDDPDSTRTKNDKKKLNEPRSMRSLSRWTGIQSTQMKHLLSPGKSSSRPSPMVGSQVSERDGKDLDPESQATSAELNYRENEKALTGKRKLYIVGTIVLCVLLIVTGTILGLKSVREREEATVGGVSLAFANDHTLLMNQGEEMQAQLNGSRPLVDHSKDEVHQISDYELADADDEEATDEEEGDSVAPEDGSDPLAEIAIPLSSTAGVPLPRPSTSLHEKTPVVVSTVPASVHHNFPELQSLFDGNARFINETNSDSPGLLAKLGLGQTPSFATLGCSDSRVSETLVTGSEVGDLFVTRNIGNQYVIDSLSTESVFSYAISHLGVSHLIVLGHTKCGAVLASIVSESKTTMSDIGENRIMTWIRPIRSLYSTSTRPEIVKFRESFAKKKKQVTAEDVTSSVWNALIEENVKHQVEQLARDPSVVQSWTLWGERQKETNLTEASSKTGKERRSRTADENAPIELWIHGFVYDVSTGLIHDLGISVGPHMKLIDHRE